MAKKKKEKQWGLNNSIIVSPSLLSSDFSNLAGEIRHLKRAGCRWVHFDVMDGNFVPNLTFGSIVVKALRSLANNLFFDVHLMIEDPEFYAPHFIEAGADLITFHQEAVGKSEKLIRLLHRNGVRAGISLRPNTPLETLNPVLNKIDLVMVMSVEPGFGGQKLIPKTLNKMRELSLIRTRRRLAFLIEADGGINEDTASLAVAAGANVLVAGSFIFDDRRISQNVRRLLDAAHATLNGDFAAKIKSLNS